MLSKLAKIQPAPVPEVGANPGAILEGEAGPEAPKKGEASQEPPKSAELRQEASKKRKTNPETSKRGKTSPESPKKEKAKQKVPKKKVSPGATKKGEVSPDTAKKGKTSPEATKKGQPSQDMPQKGAASHEAPKKAASPFGKVSFRPHHWRLVALILGVCSLVLLIALLALIGKYLHVSEATRRKMATLQKQTQKLKDSVKQQAGDKGSRCDTCLDEWVQRGDTCYLFSTVQASWPGCVEQCKKWGAHLVKMDTQGELVFLKWQTTKLHDLEFRFRQYYYYWIGLAHKAALRKWVWLDDSPFTLHLSSVSDILVSHIYDECVYFTNGKSFVRDCTLKQRCLCKKDK